MTLRLERIVSAGLTHAWPALASMLNETPMLWGGWSLKAIQQGVFSGQLQVWVVVDEERVVHMTALTQLVFYLEGTALRVVWAKGDEVIGGDYSGLGDLEEVARRAECQWVEIIGRKGWERITKPLGYKVKFQLLWKDISHPSVH